MDSPPLRRHFNYIPPIQKNSGLVKVINHQLITALIKVSVAPCSLYIVLMPTEFSTHKSTACDVGQAASRCRLHNSKIARLLSA